MSTEKEIFDLIHSKGDGLYNKVHIIDYDKDGFFSGTEFMVYHADGFCFVTSIREPQEDDDPRDIENGFVYSVVSDYDGFQKIDDENILRVLKRSFKMS